MLSDLAFSFVGGALLTTSALFLVIRSMPARSGVRLLSKVYRGSSTHVVFAGTLLVSLSGALLAAAAMQERAASNAEPIIASDVTSFGDDQADDSGKRDQAIANLRTYANGLRTKLTRSEAQPVNLPDVDTMISRLAARLDGNEDDADGWRMLGWSYLHTSRYADAVKAFETALKIDPSNADAAASLVEARSQLAANAAGVISSEPALIAGDVANTPMVRDMVERLSRRLEASPDDGEGWMQLIRSRAVLGQTEQARDALRRALASFQNDKTKRDEITSFAGHLGIGSYPAD